MAASRFVAVTVSMSCICSPNVPTTPCAAVGSSQTASIPAADSVKPSLSVSARVPTAQTSAALWLDRVVIAASIFDATVTAVSFSFFPAVSAVVCAATMSSSQTASAIAAAVGGVEASAFANTPTIAYTVSELGIVVHAVSTVATFVAPT